MVENSSEKRNGGHIGAQVLRVSPVKEGVNFSPQAKEAENSTLRRRSPGFMALEPVR